MALDVQRVRTQVSGASAAARIAPGAGEAGGIVLRSLGEGVSTGAQAFKAAEEERARVEHEQQEREAADFVTKRVAQFHRDQIRAYEQAKTETPADGKGFTDSFAARFDEAQAALLAEAPNEFAVTDAEARLERIKTAFVDNAVNYEAGARKVARVEGFKSAYRDYAQVAFAQPDQLETLYSQIDGDAAGLRAGGVSPQLTANQAAAAKEAVAVSAARGLIATDPKGALAALTEQAERPSNPVVDALSPQKRAQLTREARVELRSRDTGTASAKASVRAALDDAETAVSSMLPVSAGRLDAIDRAAAATGDEKLSGRVQRLRDKIGFQDEFRQKTPPEMQQTVNEMRSALQKAGDTSGRQAEMVALAEDMLAEARRGIAQDPLSFASRAGVVALQPLDFNLDGAGEEGDGGPANAMQARVGQAETVAGHYGTAAQFLTDEEADQLASAWRAASTDQKVALVGRVRQGFGKYAPDVLAEMGVKDPEAGHVAGLAAISPGHGQAARDALDGKAVIAENPDVVAPPLDLRPAENEVFGEAFGGLAQTRAAAEKVARAIYAKRASARGLDRDSFDEDLYKRALQEAAGATYSRDGTRYGGIGAFHGVKLLLPPEVRADEFRALLDRVEDGDLARYALGAVAETTGPRRSDGSAFTAKDLRSAYLVSYGAGQYIVSTTDPRTGVTPLRGTGPNGFYVFDFAAAAGALSRRPAITDPQDLPGKLEDLF